MLNDRDSKRLAYAYERNPTSIARDASRNMDSGDAALAVVVPEMVMHKSRNLIPSGHYHLREEYLCATQIS
jgi:hypothetical protein